MAIAFDAASGGATNSVTSRTVSHTCTGSDRALVVAVTGDHEPTDVITGVTYNGVSMTQVAKAAVAGSRYVYLFYLNAPATGTHDIVASASSATYIGIAAASYTGVSQTGQPEANHVDTAASSATLTATVTTITDNAWTVLGVSNASSTVAAGSGSTFRHSDDILGAGDGITGIFDSNAVVHPAASHSMTATAGAANDFNGVIVSLAPVAAAGSFTVSPTDVPKNHSNNITLTLAGTSTTWAGGGAEFSISGVTGATKVSENVTSTTAATLVITTDATHTGTLTITDGDAFTATLTVSTATLSFTPTSGVTGGTPSLTLTGTHTLWTTETAAGLFTVSGGTGASIGTPTITTDTAGTVTLTVGSATGTLTVTDTSTGATFAYTATAGTVAITSPVPYQTYQRASGVASIPITGTYTGTPTNIEADFNGGGYATVATGPTGGTFSGTLTGQAEGQGTLTVRFSNDHSVTGTCATVGIGDVVLIVGDSHYVGPLTNPQSYSHATLKAAKFTQANVWGEGNDPIDSFGASGSSFPLLATLWMASQSVPVAFISTAQAGTDMGTWSPGGTEYNNALTQVTNSGVNAVGLVMGSFGTNVVTSGGASQAAYHTLLSTFVTALRAAVAGTPPVLLDVFGSLISFLRADVDHERLAIMQAAGDVTGCFLGQLLYDQLYTGDDLHASTDAEGQIIARRMWPSVEAALFSGVDGHGPRVSGSITLDATKKFITITFGRDLAAGTTYGGFRVTDSGTPATIVSAVRASSRRVVIEVSSALSAVANVAVSLGSDGDAAGQTVPTTTAITLPATVGIGTVTLPAELFVAAAVVAEGSGGTAGTASVFKSGIIGGVT